jgi:hypothetical protein
LASIKLIKIDLIRKQFLKWSKLNIFTKANSIIMKQHKKKHLRNNNYSLFIDSINIVNNTGNFDYGFNIKNKNKKSLKI